MLLRVLTAIVLAVTGAVAQNETSKYDYIVCAPFHPELLAFTARHRGE